MSLAPTASTVHSGNRDDHDLMPSLSLSTARRTWGNCVGVAIVKDESANVDSLLTAPVDGWVIVRYRIVR